MKDILERRMRVERTLHNPAVQQLVCEDEKFWNAFNAVAVMATVNQEELGDMFHNVHTTLSYFTAKYGRMHMIDCLRAMSTLEEESTGQTSGRSVLMLRAWLLTELSTGLIRIEGAYVIASQWGINKVLVQRIEKQQAAQQYRKEVDLFDPSYQFEERPLTPEQELIAQEFERIWRADHPLLFSLWASPSSAEAVSGPQAPSFGTPSTSRIDSASQN